MNKVHLYIQKKGTKLKRTIMIKNGILIKVTSLEGIFYSNDATILGGKNSLLSDDKRDLYIALKNPYDFGKFLQRVSKENIGKSYTCYFYANLINGRVVRTKGMPKYQITAK
jgi:hypothetical protein|nr:MAG TPA: hypothetical protein [Caudoviricetes sp.]